MAALLGAWTPGKVVFVGVFDALTVLECEVVLLQTLKPSTRLSLRISRAQQPGHGGVFGE